MQQNISLSFHILQNQEPKSILSINFMMDTLPLATRGPDYDHHSGHSVVNTAVKLYWQVRQHTYHAHQFRSTSERSGAHMYHLFIDEIVEN